MCCLFTLWFCVDSLSSSEFLQINWGSVVVAEDIRRGRSQSWDWNQSCMPTWVPAMKPCSITQLKQVACPQDCVRFTRNTSVSLISSTVIVQEIKKWFFSIHVKLCHYTTLDWWVGRQGTWYLLLYLPPSAEFFIVIQHCDTAGQSQLDQAVNRVSESTFISCN